MDTEISGDDVLIIAGVVMESIEMEAEKVLRAQDDVCGVMSDFKILTKKSENDFPLDEGRDKGG